MRQIMKRRGFWLLLLTYTSLVAFRHIGWMLFYEQFVEYSSYDINFGFILYSGVIAMVGMLMPLIARHVNILGNKKMSKTKMSKTKMSKLLFLLLVTLALLFRVVQLMFSMTGACILLVLWTSTVMIGIYICFAHIFSAVPKAYLGRFFGFAYFADTMIVSFVELFTGTIQYYYVSIMVGVVMCVLACIFYLQFAKCDNQPMDMETDWKPSKIFIGISLVLLVGYVLIAGMMDNLYFFDDWIELPYVGLFTLPMMSIMYLIGGFILDKLKFKITLPFALLFICIAQSMTFFVTGGAFAYSYSVFSNLGLTFLELVTVIIPIHYARIVKKEYYLSSFGEGLFYGGFCITSILFQYINQASYRSAMGIILLMAVTCLLLMVELVIMYERDKHKIVAASQKQKLDALQQQITILSSERMETLPIYEEALHISYTKKEKELMPLIISSLTAEEIAAQTYLSVSTVRFHIKNILAKSDAKNRRELARILSERTWQEEVREESLD